MIQAARNYGMGRTPSDMSHTDLTHPVNPGEMRKRSVVIAGHRTSVSLENAFWSARRENSEKSTGTRMRAKEPSPFTRGASRLSVSTFTRTDRKTFSATLPSTRRLNPLRP